MKYLLSLILLLASLSSNACGSWSATAYASCFWDDEEEDYTAYYVVGGLAAIYLLYSYNNKSEDTEEEVNDLFSIENLKLDMQNGKGIPMYKINDSLTIRTLNNSTIKIENFNFYPNQTFFEQKNILSISYSF